MKRRHRPRALYLWLALLNFLAVFAATAGAREASSRGSTCSHLSYVGTLLPEMSMLGSEYAANVTELLAGLGVE